MYEADDGNVSYIVKANGTFKERAKKYISEAKKYSQEQVQNLISTNKSFEFIFTIGLYSYSDELMYVGVAAAAMAVVVSIGIGVFWRNKIKYVQQKYERGMQKMEQEQKKDIR